MRSVQLLIYRADEGVLEVRARDFKTHWMTAVEVLDDDTYLGAENSNNLFTLRKNTDAAADEDRNRLEVQVCPARPPCAVSFLYRKVRLCLEVGAEIPTLQGLLGKSLFCNCCATLPPLAVSTFRATKQVGCKHHKSTFLGWICTSPSVGDLELYRAALQ